MTSPADQPEFDGWDPDKALANLRMENALDANSTPVMLAKRLFEENLPLSVLSICHIAIHGDSEAMRFNAARYVVERTMGPAERKESPLEGPRAWDSIYDKVTVGAEEYLRTQSEAE